MSYLLESLGRGLLSRLLDAFDRQLPGDADDDVTTLATRAERSPHSADLALRLGKACLRDLRLTQARQAFEAALNMDGAAHHAAIGLACVNDELGRLDRAIELLEAAAAHDPRDPALAYGVAFCYERQGNTAAARDGYRRAASLCPTLRNAHERLAAIAVQHLDWSEAIKRYDKLCQLEPADLDAMLTLATLQLNAGDVTSAVDTFQRALLIEPEVSGEAIDSVEELENEGQLIAAIASAEKLVAKYPGVTEFHVHLGDLYVKAAEDDRAVEQYNVALELHPTFLEATVKLGTQHLRRGRYNDAALAFNRAVELNDRLLIGFVGLGVAQASCGRWRDAHATIGLAAGLAPNSTLLLSETARLQLKCEHARRGRYGSNDHRDDPDLADHHACLAESIRRHERAIEHDGDDAELHYRCGVLACQDGDPERAISAFRRAATIDPSYTKCQIKLGLALRESGAGDDADEALRCAIFATPESIDLHYSLGLLFAQRNQFELSLERYCDCDPAAGGKLRRSLLLSLQNMGMVDRAAATWQGIGDLGWSTAAPDTNSRSQSM